MRPWPQVVRDIYPTLGPRHPDRPWYNRDGDRWVRRDGLAVFIKDNFGQPRPLDVIEEMLAHHDTVRPLPHPGIRPGQIWAQVDMANSRVINTFVIDAMTPDRVCIVGEWVGARGMTRTLTNLEHNYAAFLVFDAACPHLAPWAPSLPAPG